MSETERMMMMGQAATSLAIRINTCISEALNTEDFDGVGDDLDRLGVTLSSLTKVLVVLLSGITPVDDDTDIYEEYLDILTQIVNAVMAALQGEGKSVN